MVWDKEPNLKDALSAIETTVAALRLAGVDDLAVATALMTKAGVLYRAVLPDEQDRRAVILHSAEIQIRGTPVPFEPRRR